MVALVHTFLFTNANNAKTCCCVLCVCSPASGYGIDGQPWCTSHYGFHIVAWHIVYALTGQVWDGVAGVLTFAPAVAAPFELPALVPGAAGLLTASVSSDASASTTYTLMVTVGTLHLTRLAVAGAAYPIGASGITLSSGQKVEWSS